MLKEAVRWCGSRHGRGGAVGGGSRCFGHVRASLNLAGAYAPEAGKVKRPNPRQGRGVSLVAQRLDGVQAGGLGRRPQAEEEPHRERGQEGDEDPARLDHGRER